tara:strand:+ start:325 stop:609 length:285 start_codon:yes stop_codon:yes gene_type:complete
MFTDSEWGCAGKFGHPTEAKAKQSARTINAFATDNLTVYLCTECQLWHLGHRQTKDGRKRLGSFGQRVRRKKGGGGSRRKRYGRGVGGRAWAPT